MQLTIHGLSPLEFIKKYPGVQPYVIRLRKTQDNTYENTNYLCVVESTNNGHITLRIHKHLDVKVEDIKLLTKEEAQQLVNMMSKGRTIIYDTNIYKIQFHIGNFPDASEALRNVAAVVSNAVFNNNAPVAPVAPATPTSKLGIVEVLANEKKCAITLRYLDGNEMKYVTARDSSNNPIWDTVTTFLIATIKMKLGFSGVEDLFVSTSTIKDTASLIEGFAYALHRNEFNSFEHFNKWTQAMIRKAKAV